MDWLIYQLTNQYILLMIDLISKSSLCDFFSVLSLTDRRFNLSMFMFSVVLVICSFFYKLFICGICLFYSYFYCINDRLIATIFTVHYFLSVHLILDLLFCPSAGRNILPL